MARISSYTADENLQKGDKLIGSDVDGKTKNYSIASISQYFRETNATGAAGYFPYKLEQAVGVPPDKGEVKGTFSSGLTFANLTSLKMNKYRYKDSDNPIDIALRVLNKKDILIVEVDNHNNYGIYGVGTITQDGSSDNYDLSCNYKSGNGTMVNNKIYAICLYSGRDLSYTHTQSSASTTWTIAHNLGKFPSVSIKFSTGADFNNTGALGGVTYTDENNLTINLAAAESGVAYLN